MSVPRLKMETGTRETDERDDRPTGGIFHRSPAGYKRHPMNPDELICENCAAHVARRGWKKHDRDHRTDDEWADKVEQLEAQIEALREQFAEIRGEWNMLTEIEGPSLARLKAWLEATTREG